MAVRETTQECENCYFVSEDWACCRYPTMRELPESRWCGEWERGPRPENTKRSRGEENDEDEKDAVSRPDGA